MLVLQIGIGLFAFIEVLNVMMLYYMPESRMGNGVGVFNDYFSIPEENKSFVSYLINWVAGAKLIFIMIGIVVIIFGNYYTQLFTVVALIISIASFYYRLYPIIKDLDKKGKITPKGYYKTLNMMIAGFIIGFLFVLVFALFS